MFNIEANWAVDIFRSLFAFFDWVVYGLIGFLFKAVFNLANFELAGFYESFEERVYVILGIFMLFKVTISLITYLVNPDKISDKEQGASKIVVRIITVLIMLLALPTFFDLMTEAQNKLLPVIPRVVIGTANTLKSEDAAGIAENMAGTMIEGFAHLKDECKVAGSNLTEINSPSELMSKVNETCEYNGNTIYAYDYLPIVSTIVGIAMCYVVFSLCISVAIRAFKLIILRMLAPIPIMSYIDPKSSKDGAFSHWTKTFISTWAELFVNIGIIYFIIYIIDFLLSGEAWRGFFDGISNPIDGAILLAFIIMGLLFFAESAPKFVFDALGIKNKGGFMRMLGMGANALAMGGSVASQLAVRNRENPGHGFTNFGAALFSGLAHGASGGHELLSTDKPTWHTGVDRISKDKAIAINNIEGKSTLGDRLLSKAGDILGIPTRYDEDTRKIKAYEGATAAWKRIDVALNSDDAVDSNGNKKHSVSLHEEQLMTINGEKIFDSRITYSTKDANDIVTRMKSSGQYTNEQIDNAEKILKRFQKERFDEIRAKGAHNNGAGLVGTEAQIFAGAKTIYETAKVYANDDDEVFASFKNANSIDDANLSMGGNFKAASYNASRQADVIKNSPEYVRAANAAKNNK